MIYERAFVYMARVIRSGIHPKTKVAVVVSIRTRVRIRV
jgi:hypothetical protein